MREIKNVFAETELVNCRNYFNETSFIELCTALETGKAVRIYIDCIGYTRAFYEEKTYRRELEKVYGARLTVGGEYPFNYYYLD